MLSLLTTLSSRLLETTIYAGALYLGVSLVLFRLKGRSTPGWQYAMLMVVLIRLFIPFLPESRWNPISPIPWFRASRELATMTGASVLVSTTTARQADAPTIGVGAPLQPLGGDPEFAAVSPPSTGTTKGT